MSLTKVTVTGTYTDGEGNALTGTVKFTPNATLTDTTESQLIRPVPITVTLDGSGHFSTQLYATDNANLSPSGWGWVITENLPGAPNRVWMFELPATGGLTQDISSLTPVVSVGQVSPYLPLSGGTMTGALVLNADPSANKGAATKQYVDAETSRATTAEGTKVSTPGGTPTVHQVVAATGSGAAVAWTTITDTTATDIQPLGTRAAGTSTLAAAADHVHAPTGLTATSIYLKATSALTPSATSNTFGTASTLNPGSGFTAIWPGQVSYVASSVGSETVTVQAVVTFSDNSTTTTTTTTTTSSTTSLTAAQIAALLATGDGKYVKSIAWSVKSSIGSSTASVTVTVCGLNQY